MEISIDDLIDQVMGELETRLDKMQEQLILDFGMKFASIQDEINKLREEGSESQKRINIKSVPTMSKRANAPLAYDLTKDPLFKTITHTLHKHNDEVDSEEEKWEVKLKEIQDKKSTYSRGF